MHDTLWNIFSFLFGGTATVENVRGISLSPVPCQVPTTTPTTPKIREPSSGCAQLSVPPTLCIGHCHFNFACEIITSRATKTGSRSYHHNHNVMRSGSNYGIPVLTPHTSKKDLFSFGRTKTFFPISAPCCFLWTRDFCSGVAYHASLIALSCQCSRPRQFQGWPIVGTATQKRHMSRTTTADSRKI
jgi:hypothetical protein